MAIPKIIEKHWQIHNNSIQAIIPLSEQDAELMEANWENYIESIWPEVMKMKILDIAHPQWYYCRAKELANLVDILQSNFQFHPDLLLDGDPDKA